MDCLVSVIIPVYNIENYLEECINSLCKQTLKEIEIILVDDGSMDDSGRICDKMAKLDKRIIVVHQNNKGAAAARNTGIKLAKGDYISFIDGDDFVSDDFLETMYEVCVENKVKISACNYCYVVGEKKENIKESLESRKCTCEEFLKLLFSVDKRIGPGPCNKLFHRSLFPDNGNVFPSGMYYEDLGTIYKLVLKTDSIMYVDKSLYGYRQRPGSSSTLMFSDREKDRLKLGLELLEIIKTQKPDLENESIAFFCSNVGLSIIHSMINSNHWDNEMSCFLKKFFGENLKVIWGCTCVSFKIKIRIALCAISLKLYKRVYDMYKMKKMVSKVFRSIKNRGIEETFYIILNYLRYKGKRFIDCRYDYFEKESDVKISNKTVYVIAGLPYSDIGGGQRSAQLAKTLKKLNYKVHYFYANISYGKLDKTINISLDSHALVNDKAVEFIERQVHKGDTFIFEAPFSQFEPILEIAHNKKCGIIYENIDNWETSLGETFFDKKSLEKFLLMSDVLVGTAKPLVKQLEYYLDMMNIPRDNKQILYLANAVDEDIFSSERQYEVPSDLVKGEKTFLYYGTLNGEWFKWDIIADLAERNPKYQINLIGHFESIQGIVKRCPGNIHFLGAKVQKDLPAYLQHVDYALIPFERGNIGDYVSPLKIFEYIAMHVKVLSTSLPDIAGYPNVYLGDTVERWESIIMQETDVDIEAADRFVENNNWKNRVNAMMYALH